LQSIFTLMTSLPSL